MATLPLTCSFGCTLNLNTSACVCCPEGWYYDSNACSLGNPTPKIVQTTSTTCDDGCNYSSTLGGCSCCPTGYSFNSTSCIPSSTVDVSPAVSTSEAASDGTCSTGCVSSGSSCLCCPTGYTVDSNGTSKCKVSLFHIHIRFLQM
jgi:hypothetical protein